MVQDELRHSGGGWINLRGMGTAIVTAPSQVTLGWLLRTLGIPKVNFSEPRAADYLELVVHVLLTAMLIYLLVLGAELLLRRLFGAS